MKRILALVLAVACMMSATGCGSGKIEKGETDVDATYLVNGVEYPEMAPYPDETAFFDEKSGRFRGEEFDRVYEAWRADRQAQRDNSVDHGQMESFLRQSVEQFLARSNGENRVYSPLNVYMALAVLAESTGGESRRQILDLLGAEDLDTLRERAAGLWKANYCDDGAVTSLLANSLWMQEGITFERETVDRLARYYYTSSYQGEMGSEEYNRALRNWLNEQTGGLLEEQVSGIEMSAETILALASAIYFRAKWSDEFSESRTQEGLFSVLNPDGEQMKCDFMHQSGGRNYYWGEHFSAVCQSLEGSGGMWFLLPDGDVSVEQLLADEEVMDFLLYNDRWESSKRVIVNLAVPKFDVSSQLNLIPGLKELGVRDVFDFAASDFTPMITQAENVAVTQVEHGARVAIDEKGCVAAAYTVIMACGSAMPPEEEVDFVLDRPFLFAIAGEDGLPLFVGVVNRPV